MMAAMMATGWRWRDDAGQMAGMAMRWAGDGMRDAGDGDDGDDDGAMAR